MAEGEESKACALPDLAGHVDDEVAVHRQLDETAAFKQVRGYLEKMIYVFRVWGLGLRRLSCSLDVDDDG